ncbi:hypothetical protein M8J76_013373 [Diaphorina citri]|nr:hypothetical protein M8J76_013373 [Diaphorina citri]
MALITRFLEAIGIWDQVNAAKKAFFLTALLLGGSIAAFNAVMGGMGALCYFKAIHPELDLHHNASSR